jgi:hypothetical protein
MALPSLQDRSVGGPAANGRTGGPTNQRQMASQEEPSMAKKKDADSDYIFQSRLAGRQPRAIAKELGLTLAEVEEVVEDRMVKLDPEYRLQVMALDLERLDLLTGPDAAGQRIAQVSRWS